MSTLEITTMIPCVNNCKFCPQDKLRTAYNHHAPSMMDLPAFVKLLESVPTAIRIDFSGFSEPFANPDASRMMLHAHEKGHPLALFTTLVGFGKEDADLIKDIRFHPSVLHVPEDSNFITDERHWVASYNIAKDVIRFDDACYWLGDISGYVREAVPQARFIGSALNRANNVSSQMVAHTSRKSGPIACMMTPYFDNNVLLPNGDVYICCMDWSLTHWLGNLYEQDYLEIFAGQEHRKLMRGKEDDSFDILCRYCSR